MKTTFCLSFYALSIVFATSSYPSIGVSVKFYFLLAGASSFLATVLGGGAATPTAAGEETIQGEISPPPHHVTRSAPRKGAEM
jgi:hypothetical protein